ncbi:MAG: hypothetical protein IPP43_11655 [Chitinophagaceae bacterium]|nr:hypothetical protein [Chitinophagaceae bacterium]MBK9569911.1 hypothetical protein [Chitinophagaceae bacterium]MBL0131687.1 hypothetical protein [Chitinophagaceae bacterium]MBL0274426.1 hypothetical protein [Chitinophagaceae bacterium]
MNKIKFWPLYFFFLGACNNKADQPPVEDDSTNLAGTSYSWQARLNDSSGRLEMTKMEIGGPDSLNPGSVVRYINTSNNNVQFELVKTSNDTVYVKIKDATYLTQQMGSTGTTMYLAQAIYNLTEIPGIRYVNLDFEEGDHAAPGTYSRESFANE